MREGIFIVAVQCTQAAKTCFCASMGTGPTAESGFDLALTEVLEDGQHYFLADAGSDSGSRLLAEMPGGQAKAAEQEAARAARARAAEQMGRELDVTDIRDLLYRSYESSALG